MTRRVVVLPAPLGPSRPKISPGRASRLMPRRTWFEPRVFSRRSILTAGPRGPREVTASASDFVGIGHFFLVVCLVAVDVGLAGVFVLAFAAAAGLAFAAAADLGFATAAGLRFAGARVGIGFSSTAAAASTTGASSLTGSGSAAAATPIVLE